MYGTQVSGQVAVLPSAGVGTAAAYAAGGPESWFFLFLAAFTIYAAIKTGWRLMPRFGSS